MWPVRLEQAQKTWSIALQNVVHASVGSSENVVQESAPWPRQKRGSGIGTCRLRHEVWMLSTVRVIQSAGGQENFWDSPSAKPNWDWEIGQGGKCGSLIGVGWRMVGWVGFNAPATPANPVHFPSPGLSWLKM